MIEVQFESNSSADGSQDDTRGVGSNSFTERKIEIFANHKRFGQLWLGQGDTASNGTSAAPPAAAPEPVLPPIVTDVRDPHADPSELAVPPELNTARAACRVILRSVESESSV